MNLVIVCGQYSRGNGGSSSLIDLSKAAEQLGASVDILVTQQNGTEYVRAVLGSVLHYRKRRVRKAPFTLQKRSADRQSFVSQLRRAVDQCNLIECTVFGSESVRGKLARADIILIAGLATAADFSYLRSVNSTARLVFNHPGSPSAFLTYWLGNGKSLQSATERERRRESYARLLAPYDNVLFQSPAQARELKNLFPEYSQKVVVVRPGVEEARLEQILSRPLNTQSPQRLRMITVGSVQPRKNQIDAVRILARLSSQYPNLVLSVVGGVVNKDYGRDVIEEARRLKVEGQIKFYGHRRDYAELIASSDILLHTAVAEGVPRVLREAMFLGTPIVASEISGISDLLIDEESAYLFQPGNIDQASKNIARLLDSKADRQFLADNARTLFDSRHAQDKLVSAVAENLLFI